MTEKEWVEDMVQHGVPEHTAGSIYRWYAYGIKPGSFLTSVITNDLFGAIAHADLDNSFALKNIVSFFYNRLPMACRGENALQDWKGCKR